MKKSNLLLFLILFICSSRLAALELRQYCFQKGTSLDQVKTYLAQIALSSDIININRSRHCINVGVDHSRVELFQKFLAMNYKFSINGDTSVQKRECLFEVETLSNSDKEKSDISVGNHISIGKRESSKEGRSTSMIRAMEQRLAQLYVDGTLVSLSCDIRGKVTEVSVNLGTKKTSLVTTVQMTKGQRIELSSIVKDLKNKTSGVSLSGGIQHSNTTGQEKQKTYLYLK